MSTQLPQVKQTIKPSITAKQKLFSINALNKRPTETSRHFVSEQ